MTCAQEFRDPDPVDEALQPVGGEAVALAAQVQQRRLRSLNLMRARRLVAVNEQHRWQPDQWGACAGEGLA